MTQENKLEYLQVPSHFAIRPQVYICLYVCSRLHYKRSPDSRIMNTETCLEVRTLEPINFCVSHPHFHFFLRSHLISTLPSIINIKWLCNIWGSHTVEYQDVTPCNLAGVSILKGRYMKIRAESCSEKLEFNYKSYSATFWKTVTLRRLHIGDHCTAFKSARPVKPICHLIFRVMP